MLSYILLAVQGANWQRAGGDKNPDNIRPELISWPSDEVEVLPEPKIEETFTLDNIRDELKRRRAELSK